MPGTDYLEDTVPGTDYLDYSAVIGLVRMPTYREAVAALLEDCTEQICSAIRYPAPYFLTLALYIRPLIGRLANCRSAFGA